MKLNFKKFSQMRVYENPIFAQFIFYSVPTLQSLLRIPKFLQLAKVFIQDENFICPHASCGSGHSKLPPDPSRDSSGQPTGHQRSRLPVRSNLTDFHYQFAWFTVYKVLIHKILKVSNI